MNIVSEHQLRNDQAETRHIETWVGEFARRAGLSAETQHAFDLSLVEWITNIISYAYNDTREHWITIRFRAGEGEAHAEVEDDGREFNPLTLPPVDTSTPLETRPIGGLGIHMMRRLMDQVLYRRDHGQNILSLVKRTS
jgi:anti-sigma regulatory factor (Ser/Thr protein kinase)